LKSSIQTCSFADFENFNKEGGKKEQGTTERETREKPVGLLVFTECLNTLEKGIGDKIHEFYWTPLNDF